MAEEDSTRPADRVLAAELRAAIARAGRRPSDVADAIGMRRGQLSRYLRVERSVPLDVLLEICAELRIEPGPLVDGAFSAFAGGGER